MGDVWHSATALAKEDSTAIRGKTYRSRANYSPQMLALIPYGQDSTAATYADDIEPYLLSTCRYTPSILLNYIYQQNGAVEKSEKEHLAIYAITTATAHISIAVDTSSGLVQQIQTTEHDDLYGDVHTTYHYTAYRHIDNFRYPGEIYTERFGGELRDTIKILSATWEDSVPLVVSALSDTPLPRRTIPQEKIERNMFDSTLAFIHLAHTQSQSFVARFADFLVVGDAPLSPSNGEALVQEAEAIYPGKPIRYFVPSHFHAHYTGGLRPFVYRGATVICTDSNEAYMRWLAGNTRRIQPDSLALHPKPFIPQTVIDSIVIADAVNALTIYLIGGESEHTVDFLLCYFPHKKILLEGDLAWIRSGAPPTKASARQRGLYNAIRRLGIQPDTIVQSWPTDGYGVKTVFSFQELQQSITAE